MRDYFGLLFRAYRLRILGVTELLPGDDGSKIEKYCLRESSLRNDSVSAGIMNRNLLFLVVFILALQGCTTYHPMPIDEQSVSQTLALPDLEALRVRAEEIKHPILKPRTIDFSNGISAQDAAIIAVIANPALRAERDRRGMAKAQLLQAGILPNPTFSYNLDVPTGGNTEGTVNAYGLGLDWSIIKSLLTRGAEVDSARAEATSVALDVAWKEWQVAQAAKQRVYRLLFLEKQLAVAQEEENSLEKNLEAIRKAVNMGDMTVIDLEAVNAALRRTHGAVLDIRQRLEQERLGLNRILGFPPSSKIPLRREMTLPQFKILPSLEDIMKELENRRLDLLALRQGYQSQEARLRAAVRAQFPDISIGLAHARDTSDVITTGFSVSIGLPFFDRNQGNIAIETASRKQLYDEYMDRVFQARADTAGILADFKAVEEQVDAADRAVQTLEKLVSVSYDGFLEGNIDALTYYNEVDMLTTSRLDALKLQQNLVDLHVALEITAGEFLEGAGNKKEVPEK
jgi:outer membrane protein TolC